MPYRVVFDVADRLPDIALGAAALVVLAGVILAGFWDFDAVVARWPLVILAGAGLSAMEAAVNRQLLFLAGSVVIVAIVAAVEQVNQRFPAGQRSRRTPVGGSGTAVGIFMLFFAAGSGLAMIPAMWLSSELAAGKAEVAEGPVTIDFEVGGGRNECISVADRQFCYSDYAVMPGFNRTRALGGPMRDGLQVRLSTIDDSIVRLEVPRQP